MIHRGRGKRLADLVRPWVIYIMVLYNDVCADDGTLRPVVAGGVFDQPAKIWAALRIARGEFARLRDQDRKKREAKRGRRG